MMLNVEVLSEIISPVCQTLFCHSAQQTQPSGKGEDYKQLYQEIVKKKTHWPS